MSWARRLYPPLFAIFPVLALAAQNPGRFVLRDAVVLCLLAAAAAAVALAVVYALLRRRWSARAAADRAAFVTFVGVVLFYLYPVFRWAYLHVASPTRGAALVAASAAAIVAARTQRRLQLPSLARVGRVLSAAGAIAVVWPMAQIAYLRLASTAAIERSALVRQLADPVPVRASAAGGPGRGPKRDIYVLILDEYASADVLRERFAFDNRAFEDSLRSLGFRIPASVRSNYSVTTMSVPSLLNFAHMQPLADVMRATSKDWGPATYLLEHNRAAHFLKGQGYRFLFYPTRGFAPTQGSDEADEQYAPYVGFDLARAAYGSELAAELWANTPLARLRGLIRPYNEVRVEHVARTLDGLMALPRRRELKFVVAHVLMPHVPFTVDADCRPLRSPSWERADFAGHVQCVNHMTLRAVRALIAGSATPPIIILQGDHGTQSLHPFDNAPGVLSVAQARERFRTFGAYYLPDGGDAAMPDSVSIVNVLRYVFDRYFGTDLPPLPNTMYYSNWRYPYALLRVDDEFHAVSASRTASLSIGATSAR